MAQCVLGRNAETFTVCVLWFGWIDQVFSLKLSLQKLCGKGIVGEKSENTKIKLRVLAEVQARNNIGWA